GETSFDPAATINQLAAAAGPAARARGLRFDVAVEAGLPASLIGDPARFTQLAAALIDQAIESTESGAVRLVAGVIGQG
ncbi:hypothetical protein ABTB67_18860, partial [Acinetobacter baumannii]